MRDDSVRGGEAVREVESAAVEEQRVEEALGVAVCEAVEEEVAAVVLFDVRLAEAVGVGDCVLEGVAVSDVERVPEGELEGEDPSVGVVLEVVAALAVGTMVGVSAACEGETPRDIDTLLVKMPCVEVAATDCAGAREASPFLELSGASVTPWDADAELEGVKIPCVEVAATEKTGAEEA